MKRWKWAIGLRTALAACLLCCGVVPTVVLCEEVERLTIVSDGRSATIPLIGAGIKDATDPIKAFEEYLETVGVSVRFQKRLHGWNVEAFGGWESIWTEEYFNRKNEEAAARFRKFVPKMRGLRPILWFSACAALKDNDVSLLNEGLDFERLYRLQLQSNSMSSEAVCEVLENCPSLVEVVISGERIDDKVVESIVKLKHLRQIVVRGTSVSDSFVKQCSALPHLEGLFLESTKVTDEVIPHLAAVATLEKISLSETSISSRNLRLMSEMPRLRQLSLSRTRIAGEQILELQSLRNLRRLDLYGVDAPKEAWRVLRSKLPDCEINGP